MAGQLIGYQWSMERSRARKRTNRFTDGKKCSYKFVLPVKCVDFRPVIDDAVPRKVTLLDCHPLHLYPRFRKLWNSASGSGTTVSRRVKSSDTRCRSALGSVSGRVRNSSPTGFRTTAGRLDRFRREVAYVWPSPPLPFDPGFPLSQTSVARWHRSSWDTN